MFVYDGGVLDEADLADVPADDEGRGVVLVDPSDVDHVTIPRLANRIRSALVARRTGRVAEAVNGVIRTS